PRGNRGGVTGGSGAPDMWAFGGARLHWNGSNWSGFSTRDRTFTAAWGASANDIWIVRTDGFTHWDGATFTDFPPVGATALSAVWGFAANDIWAVGPSGDVLHYNGNAWSFGPGQNSAQPLPLYAIWGANPTNIWAGGGGGGYILHYDGSSWTQSSFDGGISAIHGLAANDVWIAGGVSNLP